MKVNTINGMNSENVVEACARAGYEAGRSCVLRAGVGKYMKQPWEDLTDENRKYFRESVLCIACGNEFFDNAEDEENGDMINELNEIFSRVVRSIIGTLTGPSLARRRQLERTELVKRKVATW